MDFCSLNSSSAGTIFVVGKFSVPFSCSSVLVENAVILI